MVKDPATELAQPVGEAVSHHPLPPGNRGFFGHPLGLRTLFFTEMWERFSFYGMRAILMLFMTAAVVDGGLGFGTDKAGPILAIYTSLVYLVSVPGGWLADNFLGQRRSVLYGGIVIMLGHILLAFHGLPNFYAGLGCIVVGTGLLKPNISVIVGQLYASDDERRDAGFSIFYMGINIGALVSPLVCSTWLAEGSAWKAQLVSWGMDPARSWHWGFGAAAVGMFFGLVQYILTGKYLGEAGLRPTPPKDAADAAGRRRVLSIGVIVTLALIGGTAAVAFSRPDLFTSDNIHTGFTYFLLGVVVLFFGKLFLTGDWTRSERARLVTILVLFCGAAIFWGLFEQAASTLTLFARDNTRNTAFGMTFGAGTWQALNPLLIIALAPFFAWLWVRLGKKNPSYPAKFGIGLFFAGLGFALLIWGSALAKNGVRVSPMWLVGVYLLHTIGELFLSPVGLSSMTKLAPTRVVSLMMGVWFLASSVGNFLAHSTSAYYDKLAQPTLFTIVAMTGFLMALIMFLLVGPIRRMMERSQAPQPTPGH